MNINDDWPEGTIASHLGRKHRDKEDELDRGSYRRALAKLSRRELEAEKRRLQEESRDEVARKVQQIIDDMEAEKEEERQKRKKLAEEGKRKLIL